MEWFVRLFRENPELAIFLTLGIGFWIGNLKYKGISLGIVTSVLLVGVVVGQMNIEISGPMKSTFFLLFLFSIGYSVGPEFFRAMRSNGLKQVLFAIVLCLMCLLAPFGVSKLFGFNTGEAVGLLAGSQTMSAILGVGTSTIETSNVASDIKQQWYDIMPVSYAVTYLFGTIGSAYLLSMLGPLLLGGLKKVKAQTKELEVQLNKSEILDDPAFENANRPVVFRAYKIEGAWFTNGKTVQALEEEIQKLGRTAYVERVRKNDKLVEPHPDLQLEINNDIVLSGRREYVIEDEGWIGEEIHDAVLLNFPVEKVYVLVNHKGARDKTVEQLNKSLYMHGVTIRSITRTGIEIPVLKQTLIHEGDRIEIVGLTQDIMRAAPCLGYVERPSNKTDFTFVSLGIVIGGIIGSLAFHLGQVPISLSTSGGALIAGLVLGWLRTKRPMYGNIPPASLWILNNIGLNMFIAVVGITTGPKFITGLQDVGLIVFVAGILSTSIPLILGVIIGDKLFKFHPAVTLGCCAGGRTTTAALGAIQDTLESTIPALGYTVTYAVGNTLLILWGVVIVLLMM
ncbi:MAG TPA: aspartate-alanine antiporter [Porphyromonadaceae bacterium]|nr:aspartate-alanine antiporter [Porphyromonadaceae bacterium]